MHSDIVVLGAGIAGYTLAVELAHLDARRRVVVIGDEPEFPYDRPPLSKEFLREGVDRVALLPELSASNVEVWRGDAAVEVDVAGRIVRTASGRSISWAQLVFATGCVARELVAPTPKNRIHSLRSLVDARHLRESLQCAASILLIGGGPIGLELASHARLMNLQTTVVDAAPALMVRSVPAQVSDSLLRFHQRQGVDVRLGCAIAGVSDDGIVRLANGSELTADVIVVGIGARPNDGLAQRAGIATQDGILVDERLQTSVPSVYAIGDVARYRDADSGSQERAETWSSARDQARALARILVDPAGAPAYQGHPWFWSDQGGLMLHGAGASRGDAQTIRGDAASDSYSVLQWQSGRLCGVTSVNAPRDFQLLRKLIGESLVDLGELSEGSLTDVKTGVEPTVGDIGLVDVGETEAEPIGQKFVCEFGALQEGEITQATLEDGRRLALYIVDGKVYATDDKCTHGNASLAEMGSLEGCVVECGLHMGSFDIRTGAVVSPPCTEPLRIYPVRIAGRKVWLESEPA